MRRLHVHNERMSIREEINEGKAKSFYFLNLFISFFIIVVYTIYYLQAIKIIWKKYFTLEVESNREKYKAKEKGVMKPEIKDFAHRKWGFLKKFCVQRCLSMMVNQLDQARHAQVFDLTLF